HQPPVGRQLHSAFARFPDLPPPAPGAHVLSSDSGPGAGRAADGAVALVVERVVGHFEGADVLPHLVFAPVGERIELDDPALGVEFLEFQIGARDGLLAALAGDPGFLAPERAIERFDFADVAATLAQLPAFIERIAAEARDVLGDRPGVGTEHAHLVAVARADRRDHVER